MEAAYEGRFPADYLSSEHLLMHDLAACFWIGLKHCSVRTAVPNRSASGLERCAACIGPTPCRRPPKAPLLPARLSARRGAALLWATGAGMGLLCSLPPCTSQARLHVLALLLICRTLLCRATGASAELLCDREVAALVAMDWGVNALLRSAGLVQ